MRTYAQAAEAITRHFRTRDGAHEADLILERADAGRIGRLRMRPMSMYETGHSSGDVSMRSLLAGAEPTGVPAELAIPDILERVIVGGWPDLLGASERTARAWQSDYRRMVPSSSRSPRSDRRNEFARLVLINRAAALALSRE